MRLSSVGIVGVGLIGASLGMAIRRRGIAGRVIGVDTDPQALAVARARGAIDAAVEIDRLSEAEVVIVATPPDAVVETVLRAASLPAPGAVLTDVASAKARIVRTLDARLPAPVRYVGGHPMAGSEERGPGAADAALLEGRPFLLTPTERTGPEAVETVSALAREIGMRPVMLTPEQHDELVAQVSHLPYLLAAAAVAAASDEAADVAGPAFAALARVAAGPAALWSQICRQNSAAIRQALAAFRRELDRLEQALDDEALQGILQRSPRQLRVKH